MTSAGGYFRASVRRFLELPPAWIERRTAAMPGPSFRMADMVTDWPDWPLPEEIAAGDWSTDDNDGGREGSAPEGASGDPVCWEYAPANAEQRHAGRLPEPTSAKGAASRQAPIIFNDPEAPADKPPAVAKDVPACVVPDLSPGAGGCNEVRAPMVSTPVDRVAHGATVRNRPPAGASSPPAVSRQALPKAERVPIAGIASEMDRRASVVDQAARAAAAAVPDGKARCRCAGDIDFVPAWFGLDCIEARCPLKVAA